MFRRFAAASAIASVAIGIAALAVSLLPLWIAPRFCLLTRVWCFAPLVWGLWAMVTPKSWVPQRLPLWGAILGLVAGLFVMLVLNMPSRIVGVELSAPPRGLAVLILMGFYYLLWMLVRVAYRSLTPPA